MGTGFFDDVRNSAAWRRSDATRDHPWYYSHWLRLIPLSQVNQNLGLAGQIRNRAVFEFFARS
jgi:hypothetical protein